MGQLLNIKGEDQMINVKQKQKEEEGVLYVRGFHTKYIDFIDSEAHDLGYQSRGEYLNEVFKQITEAHGKKTRNKIRRKSGPKAKGAS